MNIKQFQSQRKQSKWNKVLKSIANIFIPLIPAFIGAGLIGGIAAIFLVTCLQQVPFQVNGFNKLLLS